VPRADRTTLKLIYLIQALRMAIIAADGMTPEEMAQHNRDAYLMTKKHYKTFLDPRIMEPSEVGVALVADAERFMEDSNVPKET
jgi:hypothetical protein